MTTTSAEGGCHGAPITTTNGTPSGLAARLSRRLHTVANTAPPRHPVAARRRIAIAGLGAVLATGALLVVPVPTASAAPSESAPVWRAQLRVVTGNVSDAGTDDRVQVSLNDSNVTRVDTPADDFERGRIDTFDLLPTGVRRFSDLQRVRIDKIGTDGWCIARVTLIVNGRTLFDSVPGSPCRWIDTAAGHSPRLQWTTLRTREAWRFYVQPPLPTRISPAELRDRIETYVGHAISTNALYWGHFGGAAAVEFSNGGTSHRVRVDLDLAADVPFFFDPEVDVEFTLVFSCSSGVIRIATTNFAVDVDSSLVWKVLTLGAVELLDDLVRNAIQGSFSGFTFTTDTGTPFCPIITVSPDGTITFS
jgi:hypothetical protein